jgi:hypothetical protein
MRVIGWLFADLALRRAVGERAPVRSQPDDGLGWDDELAAAWRAWRQAGEHEAARRARASDWRAPGVVGPQAAE